MLLGCALASADVHAHAFSLSCVQPPARTTGGPLNAAARPASQVNGTATPTTLFGALPSPLPRSRVRGAVVGRAHASLPLRVVLLQRGAPTVLAALPACLSASACGAAGAAAARCADCAGSATCLPCCLCAWCCWCCCGAVRPNCAGCAALPACLPASTCACGAATYVCPDDCTGMGEGHCGTDEPARTGMEGRDATWLCSCRCRRGRHSPLCLSLRLGPVPTLQSPPCTASRAQSSRACSQTRTCVLSLLRAAPGSHHRWPPQCRRQACLAGYCGGRFVHRRALNPLRPACPVLSCPLTHTYLH